MGVALDLLHSNSDRIDLFFYLSYIGAKELWEETGCESMHNCC